MTLESPSTYRYEPADLICGGASLDVCGSSMDALRVANFNDTAGRSGRWDVVGMPQAVAAEVRSSIRPIISIVAIAAAPG